MAKDNPDNLTVMLADRIWRHVRQTLVHDSYLGAFYSSMFKFMPRDLPPEVDESDRDMFWEAQICKDAARFLIYYAEHGEIDESHIFNEAFKDDDND